MIRCMNHHSYTHNENTAYHRGSFLAAALLSLLIIFQSCTSSTQSLPKISEAVNVTQIPDEVQFNVIWGYVMKGRENELNYDSPLSDIGYFAAEINCYGELPDIPDR